VQGIGALKAAKIAYYNLCNMLGSSANYFQARSGSIAAAAILFGNCSFEVMQTKKAWAAVGLGPVTECFSIVGPSAICADDLPITLQAVGGQSGTYTWSWPSGVTANASGNLLTIRAVQGKLPVVFNVTVTDNLGNVTTLGITVFNCLPYYPSPNDRSLTEHLIEIFPNPAHQEVRFVSHERIGSAIAKVFDTNGRMLQFSTIDDINSSMNLESLLPGAYQIQLNNDAFYKTFKLIKQ
jgi:Thermolysin metallopeptidase, alpha-helical domain/Secretion system C-terminal sorting domain